MQEKIDVLIIGAGASGLTAALAAHEEGASVMVLEKGAQLGGSAAISGGIVWMPNNHLMEKNGLQDSPEEGMAYFKSLNHGDIREEMLKALVNEGPAALAKLVQLDALSLSLLEGYPDYYLDRPGAKPEGGRAMDHELFAFGELGAWAEKIYSAPDIPRLMLRETPLGGASGYIEPEELERRVDADERGWGQAMVARLLKACLDRKIVPNLSSPVESISPSGDEWLVTVKNADGQKSSSQITVSRGVIIATGGFEWNEQLRQTFLKGPLDAPASPPMNQGDGLKLAMSVGAGLGNMTSAWWVPTVSIPGNNWPDGSQRSMPVLIERTLPHTILVNAQGKRFCNEANNYSALAGAFHAFNPETYDYANLPAYLIFDHQYKMKYPLAYAMPGEETPEWIVKSDTLLGLAENLGIDPEQLNETVMTFNQSVADGIDREFNRGASDYDRFYGDRSREGVSATLGSISNGPFYACEIKFGALGTNGGALTDAMSRVVDVNGEIIPGLFAAGNVMAAATGGVYAGAGGTLGPALTFGFIAGREAAQRNK